MKDNKKQTIKFFGLQNYGTHQTFGRKQYYKNNTEGKKQAVQEKVF